MARRARPAGLAADRRGAAAVEFAVVATAFLTVVLLLLEVAWQMAVGAALDHGAREASRWAITGQAARASAENPAASREGEILRIVTTAAGLPLDGSLGVTVRSYGSFAAAGLDTAGPCVVGPRIAGSAGGPDAVVRYDISYLSAGLTGFSRRLLPSGLLTHCVVLLTTNEPFPE